MAVSRTDEPRTWVRLSDFVLQINFSSKFAALFEQNFVNEKDGFQFQSIRGIINNVFIPAAQRALEKEGFDLKQRVLQKIRHNEVLDAGLIVDCWLVASILKTSNDKLNELLQLLKDIIFDIDIIIADFDALTSNSTNNDCEFINDCKSRYANKFVNYLIKIFENAIETRIENENKNANVRFNQRHHILIFCNIILQMRMEFDRRDCCNKLSWKVWKCRKCGHTNSIEKDLLCQKCDLGVGVHQCFHHVFTKFPVTELGCLQKEFGMILVPTNGHSFELDIDGFDNTDEKIRVFLKCERGASVEFIFGENTKHLIGDFALGWILSTVCKNPSHFDEGIVEMKCGESLQSYVERMTISGMYIVEIDVSDCILKNCSTCTIATPTKIKEIKETKETTPGAVATPYTTTATLTTTQATRITTRTVASAASTSGKIEDADKEEEEEEEKMKSLSNGKKENILDIESLVTPENLAWSARDKAIIEFTDEMISNDCEEDLMIINGNNIGHKTNFRRGNVEVTVGCSYGNHDAHGEVLATLYKKYGIFAVLDDKLACDDHKRLGSPFKRYKALLLALIAFTSSSKANYQVSSAMRKGDYSEWKVFVKLLGLGLSILSKFNNHRPIKAYRGLHGVQMIEKYCPIYLTQFSSFSYDKEVAETFRREKGMVIILECGKLDASLYCDVGWISPFSEGELLFAPFALEMTQEWIDKHNQQHQWVIGKVLTLDSTPLAIARMNSNKYIEHIKESETGDEVKINTKPSNSAKHDKPLGYGNKNTEDLINEISKYLDNYNECISNRASIKEVAPFVPCSYGKNNGKKGKKSKKGKKDNKRSDDNNGNSDNRGSGSNGSNNAGKNKKKAKNPNKCDGGLSNEIQTLKEEDLERIQSKVRWIRFEYNPAECKMSVDEFKRQTQDDLKEDCVRIDRRIAQITSTKCEAVEMKEQGEFQCSLLFCILINVDQTSDVDSIDAELRENFDTHNVTQFVPRVIVHGHDEFRKEYRTILKDNKEKLCQSVKQFLGTLVTDEGSKKHREKLEKKMQDGEADTVEEKELQGLNGRAAVAIQMKEWIFEHTSCSRQRFDRLIRLLRRKNSFQDSRNKVWEDPDYFARYFGGNCKFNSAILKNRKVCETDSDVKKDMPEQESNDPRIYNPRVYNPIRITRIACKNTLWKFQSLSDITYIIYFGMIGYLIRKLMGDNFNFRDIADPVDRKPLETKISSFFANQMNQLNNNDDLLATYAKILVERKILKYYTFINHEITVTSPQQPRLRPNEQFEQKIASEIADTESATNSYTLELSGTGQDTIVTRSVDDDDDDDDDSRNVDPSEVMQSSYLYPFFESNSNPLESPKDNNSHPPIPVTRSRVPTATRNSTYPIWRHLFVTRTRDGTHLKFFWREPKPFRTFDSIVSGS